MKATFKATVIVELDTEFPGDPSVVLSYYKMEQLLKLGALKDLEMIPTILSSDGQPTIILYLKDVPANQEMTYTT